LHDNAWVGLACQRMQVVDVLRQDDSSRFLSERNDDGVDR
jgi:hypothetical protein